MAQDSEHGNHLRESQERGISLSIRDGLSWLEAVLPHQAVPQVHQQCFQVYRHLLHANHFVESLLGQPDGLMVAARGDFLGWLDTLPGGLSAIPADTLEDRSGTVFAGQFAHEADSTGDHEPFFLVSLIWMSFMWEVELKREAVTRLPRLVFSPATGAGRPETPAS